MKDLRKDFNYSSKSYKMSKGHEKKFENRLDDALGKAPKQDFSIIYKMVAVAVIAVLSTIFISNYWNANPADPAREVVQTNKFSLADVSPELKTIENYYLTSIKLELATLETTEEHDAMINSYLDELKNINKAYKDLEKDLNDYGVTEEIINAMIDNLQLRLELLHDLKQKLNNLNKTQNEKNPVYQI